MTDREAVLEQSINIGAPAEVVWALATDWSRQEEWMLGTEVHVTSGDGASVGSQLAAFTGIRGVGFLDLMEIVEWDPPRRCVVAHKGDLLRGTGEFAVVPTGDQCATFVWSERLRLPLGALGAVSWQIIRPFAILGLRRSLHNFASTCTPSA